jgi:tetratricopeptide (TPR) repeat protein
MFMGAWNRWAVAAVTLLSSVSYGSEARWVEVRSPHFSVVTDAGEKRGREVALRFEQMRAVFGALMVKAKVSQPVPLQIIAFRSTKELRQFAPLWKGKPTEVAGLFQAASDRDYIMVDLSVEDPWEVVFHEYGHQLLNANTTASSPLWFDEGFAGYFSTIKVEGKKASVGLIPREAALLLQNGLMKTRDLFEVGHQSRVYNESGDHRSVFYMQSWLVVHWLYDTKKIPRVADYIAALDDGATVDTAVQKAFGVDAAGFDKEIRQYLSGNRMHYYSLPTPEGIENSGYSLTPLTELQAKAILADVHLHSEDYRDQALKEAQEVLAVEPNNEIALRSSGYYYMLKQDFEKAGEYFGKAATENSKDSRTHYLAAVLLNREGGGSRMDSSKADEMKGHLEKAIALDPEYADAYYLLAFALVSSDDKKGAIEAARRAVELNPRNPDYRMNLAQMYAFSQQWEGAITVLRTLAKSSDPLVVARAAQFQSQVEAMQQYAKQGAGIEVFSRRTGAVAAPMPPAEEEEPATPPMTSARAVRFTRGKLVSVDCSAAPSALLTVATALKTWKLRVANTRQVVLIGAKSFGCDWANKNVAVNFRETGADEGSVVSLEVQ